MKYERPTFKQEGVDVYNLPRAGSDETLAVPKPDYPITPKENFYRVVNRDNPLWVPNTMTEIDSYAIGTGIGIPNQSQWGGTERREFTDAWGVINVWVPEVGAPMNKPGWAFMDDVTQWEEKVKFPEWGENWEEAAKVFMDTRYDPDKPLRASLGQGVSERLVQLMGGYELFCEAIMIEPEACRAFFDRFADYTIEMVERMLELVPYNLIGYNDDWGTEKSTFWSNQVMEDLIYEPTKRIIDACKSKGAAFELHCCGHIEPFVPYMISMGVDFLQIQRRANDMPKLKEMYGDKIGFSAPIEGLVAGEQISVDEYCEKIRNSVDIYASGGGMYTAARGATDEHTWYGSAELYYYSREFYDKEQGRD